MHPRAILDTFKPDFPRRVYGTRRLTSGYVSRTHTFGRRAVLLVTCGLGATRPTLRSQLCQCTLVLGSRAHHAILGVRPGREIPVSGQLSEYPPRYNLGLLNRECIHPPSLAKSASAPCFCFPKLESTIYAHGTSSSDRCFPISQAKATSVISWKGRTN